MQCTNPWYYEKLGLVLPCGQCLSCRIAKSREWYVRLWHELTYFDKSLFATLSYRDECLPSNFQLEKKALQDFIKRLRTKTKSKLKYYACGEYGDETERPHYHAIIFGIAVSDHTIHKRWNLQHKSWALIATSGPCVDAWPFGEVILGYVEKDSLRYVTDYVKKKLTGSLAETDGRIQPFSICSNGLGKRFCLDNADQIRSNQNITVFGQSLGLPRYYVKLLDIADELVPKIDEKEVKKAKQLTNQEYKDWKKARRAQRAKILDKKQELFRSR